METGSIEGRVARLEKTNRLLVIAWVATVGAAVALGFRAKPDEITEVVKARALLLYSADNKVIVQGGYDSYTKGGRLAISDENGERKSWWRASPGGSHLYLSAGLKESKDELPADDWSVVLGARNGTADISVWGKGNKSAVILANKEFDPELTIYGDGEEPVFTTRKKG